MEGRWYTVDMKVNLSDVLFPVRVEVFHMIDDNSLEIVKVDKIETYGEDSPIWGNHPSEIEWLTKHADPDWQSQAYAEIGRQLG